MRSLNRNSFEFKLEEWEYLDEWHTTETVNFVVAEEGEYELACGASMVVGRIHECHEAWIEETFTSPFAGTPVVMS